MERISLSASCWYFRYLSGSSPTIPGFHLLGIKEEKPAASPTHRPHSPLISHCVGSYNRICERTSSRSSLRCVFSLLHKAAQPDSNGEQAHFSGRIRVSDPVKGAAASQQLYSVLLIVHHILTGPEKKNSRPKMPT